MPYRHYYSIIFSVETVEKDPNMVPGKDLRSACESRTESMGDLEWQEAAIHTETEEE